MQLFTKILTISTLTLATLTSSFQYSADAQTKLPSAEPITNNLINSNMIIAQTKQNNNSYIGVRYERGGDLPFGVQYIAGWVVGTVNDKIIYSVNHVSKGSQEMLWFEILVTDQYGKNYAHIIDVMNLPKLKKPDNLNVFCSFKGVRDPEIITILKYNPNSEYLRNIRKAWRASIKSGKFEPISTRNIVCENPGAGA